MKKNIVIFCTALTALSLTTFGFVNWNNKEVIPEETLSSIENVDVNQLALDKIENRIYSDFIYDVGPRFSAYKKSELDQATSMVDFLSEEHAQRIVSYSSVEVIIIENDRESHLREIGYSDELNTAQIELLRSADYSTNFKIRAYFKEKNETTGTIEENYSSPHLTVVPEHQAVYDAGKKVLIAYLKENTKEVITNVNPDQLKPAKLFFTVTKEGTIRNVHLDRSSGYPNVDQRMMELITKAAGSWKPAQNSIGNKVDQELVVSFGLMGC